MAIRITLSVNGTSFSKWHEAVIHKSMNEIAPYFQVASFNYNLGSLRDWEIKFDDECEIKIADETILTGYIEDIFLNNSNLDGGYITFGGRGKTSVLVDCCRNETPNEWKRQTVGNLINNLCRPFDVTVSNDSSISSQASQEISDFKSLEGQTAFDNILRLCNDYGIIPLAKGDGSLLLTRATTSDNTTDKIEMGYNAFACSAPWTNRNRYSKYVVKGQGLGGDNKSISDFTEPKSEFEDSVLQRDKTTVIFADNIIDTSRCRTRAKWEAWLSAGMSRTIKYTVNRWVQSDEVPWDINKLVRVKDRFLDIDDTMLIYMIDYWLKLDRHGEPQAITDIYVCDKNTYSLGDNIQIGYGFDN